MSTGDVIVCQFLSRTVNIDDWHIVPHSLAQSGKEMLKNKLPKIVN